MTNRLLPARGRVMLVRRPPVWGRLLDPPGLSRRWTACDDQLLGAIRAVAVVGCDYARAAGGVRTADGYRVLIDHVWPRGVSHERANVDEQAHAPAPRGEVRRRFDHIPERFDEFAPTIATRSPPRLLNDAYALATFAVPRPDQSGVRSARRVESRRAIPSDGAWPVLVGRRLHIRQDQNTLRHLKMHSSQA
jgi:hypothetical protein